MTAATETGGWSQLQTLFWSKSRISRHWIASVRTESRLKVAFVSISAVGLWLGAFLFSWGLLYGFERFGQRVLGTEGGVNLTDLLLTRMLSVMALTIFTLLVVSNVLVAFATIYRAKEVAYLIQAPISMQTFFLGRFVECVSFSSWALAFLGSPLLLAYGLERGASPGYYLALVLFYLPFVTIPAALGSMTTMLLVRVFANLRRGSVVALGLGGIALVFGFLRSRPTAEDELSQAETVQAVLDIMGSTQSAFLPSSWLADGLLAAMRGNLADSAFHWFILAANAAFLVLVATWLADAVFYKGWTALRSAEHARGPRTRRSWGLLEAVSRILPEPSRSLVLKDLRLFWRDPAQWSQFLIFFGLMALYVANIRNNGGFLSQEPWRGFVALLNMSASMLILATLTTRFIFPLISLEGKRFWILGLAPLGVRRLLLQKFTLSVLTTSFFTVGLALVSGYRLELDRFEFAVSLGGVALATVALSGLAVGLGSLYPNFEDDNPARITSGMGGTLNFILSLVFIIAVTVGQTLLLQSRRAEGELGPIPWIVCAVLVVLTVLTTLVPMRLGLRNLQRAEF
ncbi:MAG: hypothetical protein AAF690_14095, partial [Acidobacteriota bacterium]